MTKAPISTWCYSTECLGRYLPRKGSLPYSLATRMESALCLLIVGNFDCRYGVSCYTSRSITPIRGMYGPLRLHLRSITSAPSCDAILIHLWLVRQILRFSDTHKIRCIIRANIIRDLHAGYPLVDRRRRRRKESRGKCKVSIITYYAQTHGQRPRPQGWLLVREQGHGLLLLDLEQFVKKQESPPHVSHASR